MQEQNFGKIDASSEYSLWKLSKNIIYNFLLFTIIGTSEPTAPLSRYLLHILIEFIFTYFFSFFSSSSVEMIGFTILDPNMAYIPHNLTFNDKEISLERLEDLQRGKFITVVGGYGLVFEEVSIYDPPPLDLYTKFSLGTYFLAFWVLLLAQNITIAIVDKIWVKTIPQIATSWERLIHTIVKSHFPFPYTNWHEATGDCQDHIKRQKEAQHEVLVTMSINLIFNMLMG